jgi:hypothetical protein
LRTLGELSLGLALRAKQGPSRTAHLPFACIITSGTRRDGTKIEAFAAQNSRRCSVSEIFEVCRDLEVASAHKLNYGLQVVFLFSGDANLPVL